MLRLSKIVTVFPSSKSFLANAEPMNPAPPVKRKFYETPILNELIYRDNSFQELLSEKISAQLLHGIAESKE